MLEDGLGDGEDLLDPEEETRRYAMKLIDAESDKGLSIYYVILFWPLSDPYPIKLAASYLLETPLAINIDNKIKPLPLPCYTDLIFSLTHPPLLLIT